MTRADAGLLADLMLRAYRGTVDDAGEGPDEARAEVDRWLAGAFGAADLDASQLIERAGIAASATLISHHDGAPLVAFSMTAPEWKRQGLARAGLVRAMHRLRAAGYDEVRLVVTCGNTPAESMYASLGFTELDRR